MNTVNTPVRSAEPDTRRVCITGYSAMLPGASGADAVWRVLSEGRCVISEIPEDRWSSHRFLAPDHALPGHSYTRRAGVLDDIYAFDPGYFGITPREAEQMDPQQRVLLETAAQALDHAGMDPDRVTPDRVGVFIGASSSEHSNTMLQDPRMAGAQYMLGNTASILANRISHHWDFRGPSVTVDTACSSGLVALDHARQAIEAGIVDIALVGAVNLLLSPVPFVGFSQASMLSRVGLCQAFGADADGYVRSEGAAVFVLERLDSARPAGRQVRSVLVTTAVSTAGRTPGIALPSAERQGNLMQAAMQRGGFDPDALAFVEAHGTGTAVGDPIEAHAIGQSYGQRRAVPLPIGSAKSNFGHLEPASGLVGLLKAQLALEKGVLPPTLHCEVPNPHIDFATLNLDLVREARELPATAGALCAAVNSFGFGGANAHAVIRQPGLPARRTRRAEGRAAQEALPPALLLSAASGTALDRLASEWRQIAAAAPEDLGDRIATANWRRRRHRHRLCIAAGDPVTLAAGLEAWLDGDAAGLPGASVESGLQDAPVAFVFAGNGALWTGAGCHLFETDPVFRGSFLETAEGFADLGLPDPRVSLDDPDLEARAEAAEIAQPLTYAIQLALADALAAAGLRPAATVGHSLGEVAAAVVAGRLSRADGQRIIAQRCHAFAPLRGTGTMAALAASRARVAALIHEVAPGLEVSAENAPESVTVSGPAEALEHLLRQARRQRIAGRMLPIAYPYHSGAVERLRDDLVAGLADISPTPGRIPFYSGWLGAEVETPLDGTYWWNNARAPVAFRDAVTATARGGARVFLELSPRVVLRGYLRDILADLEHETTLVESLDASRPDRRSAPSICRAVMAAGGSVDRPRVLGPARPAVGGLPDYPFDRRHYKLDTPACLDIFARRPQHPLLGGRLHPDATEWQGEILLARAPWLADHRVAGRVLLPATAMIEMFVAAGVALTGAEPVELRDVEFLKPVEIPALSPVAVRIVHDAAGRRLRLETGGTGAWGPVAVARLFTASGSRPEPVTLPDGPETASGTLYAQLAAAGLEYGPAFARAEALSASDGSVAVRLASDTAREGFLFDPCLADAGLHGAAVLTGQDGLRVPARVDRVRFHGAGRIAAARLSHAGGTPDSFAIHGVMCDGDGVPVLTLHGLRLRPFPAAPTPPHAYWDERLVPLAGQGADWIDGVARGLSRAPSDTASDADVLRGALGGRLAWDRLAATGAGTPAPLDEIAADWLVAAGHAAPQDHGPPRCTEPCPWPEIDDLMALLPQVAPGSSVELKSALLALGGGTGPHVPRADLTRTLAAALSDPAARRVGRIALAGTIDRALLAAALRLADHVTLLAEDETALARQRARLGGRYPVRHATPDASGVRESADLLVLSGIGQGTTGGESLSGIVRALAPGGAVLAVEEAADIFALMTGRHDETGSFDRLCAALKRAGVEVHTGAAATSESLRLIHGTRPARAPRTSALLAVTGEGPMAEALRQDAAGAASDAVPVTVVVHGPGDDPLWDVRVLSTLPEAEGPVWLVAEGPERFETLTGWRRVIVNETGRDIRLICHAADIAADRIAALIRDTAEQEILITVLGAFSPRLVPVDLRPDTGGPRRLTAARRGAGPEALAWEPVPEQDAPLAADAVEIDVAAAGLNFRDVMWAQGLLPPESLEGGFAGACLGMECAGIVRRAGPDAGVAVGDRVIALAPHALSNRVVTPASAVMPCPAGVDPVTAAGLPVVFLTADYALNEVARLTPGETVLIHGAAGGVGQAALQVALRIGARVIATAGTPGKRRFVRALGADLVFDSRSLAFEDAVREATDGRGVDVVLNSLAGEALERSLACLAPFGRFIELGKRDLYENSAIALRAMRRNVSFHVVDVDQLLTHRPEAAARSLSRLAEALESGAYTPLPTEIHAAEDADEAMRCMQGATHVGKIVLCAPDLHAPVPVTLARPIRGAWLVTGGTSGFGLETARWLARQGARHLWLLSRTGRIAPEALAAIEAEGAAVTPLAADVTDAEAMAGVLERVRAGADPFCGVVHAAAVFDDAPLADLDADRMRAVLAPKLDGARLLDRLTQGDALDHFWLFSSVASRFGNPAQAPYVAANRGLEGIAAARARAGLAALAVAWGPVGDAGYLSRSADLREALSKRMPPMSAAEALAHLEKVLAEGHCGPTITIAPVDWGRLAGSVSVIGGPLFEVLQIDPERSDEGRIDLAALVAEKGPAKAREILTRLLVEEAAQLMRAAPGDIDPHQPLQRIGFDSLMAMNLRLAVEERLDLTVPVMSIDDSLTLAALVNRILETCTGGDTETARDGVVEQMARRHLAGAGLSTARAAELGQRVQASAEDR